MRCSGLAFAAVLLGCDMVTTAPVENDEASAVLSPRKSGLRNPLRIMRSTMSFFSAWQINGAVKLHDLVWSSRQRKGSHRRQLRMAEVVKGFLAAGLQVSPTKNGYPDFSNEKAVRPGNLLYGEYQLYPDHSWAQVVRFGSGCNAAIEGLSRGFVSDCGSNYTKMGRPELAPCEGDAKKSANVGYGCWFFFSDPFIYKSNSSSDLVLGSTSGIAVNVGKSLRVDTRADASAALALPCDNPPFCDMANTVQDKVRVLRGTLLCAHVSATRVLESIISDHLLCAHTLFSLAFLSPAPFAAVLRAGKPARLRFDPVCAAALRLHARSLPGSRQAWLHIRAFDVQGRLHDAESARCVPAGRRDATSRHDGKGSFAKGVPMRVQRHV